MNIQAIASKWAAIKPEMVASQASQKHIQSVLESMQRQILCLCAEVDKADGAFRLAERVAKLNAEVGEIGAGMLASLVEDARRSIAGQGQQVRAPYSRDFYCCSCSSGRKDECTCNRDASLSNTLSANSGVARSSNTD